MTFAVLGTLVLAAFSRIPNLAIVAVSCFVIGLGMGLVANPSLIAAQASVGWNERGVVTGTNLFARSIGSALGVAIFGAIANSIIFARGGSDTNVPNVVAAASAVYVAVAVAAIATVAAGFAMPRKRAAVAPDATGETVPAAG